MNHLSEFLQSEHAARYVATAKKEGHSTVLMASGDYFLSGIVGRDNKNPSDTKWINPWERIWLSLEIRTDFTRNEVLAKNVSAYFRREGDRYIVSDLGESVRALRLASGLKSGDDINAAQRAAIAEASSYPFSGTITQSKSATGGSLAAGDV